MLLQITVWNFQHKYNDTNCMHAQFIIIIVIKCSHYALE